MGACVGLELACVGVPEDAAVVHEVARCKVAASELFAGAVEVDVLGEGAVGAWWWLWIAWRWQG